MPHDFRADLEAEKQKALLPLWQEIYRRCFGSCSIARCEKELDKKGADRLVTLRNGSSFYAQEKYREKNWGDVLLEYWSAKETRERGWIAKDSIAEWFVYVMEQRFALVMPFSDLRELWKRDRVELVKYGRRIEALNKGYTTISVGVRIPVVTNACSKWWCLDLKRPQLNSEQALFVLECEAFEPDYERLVSRGRPNREITI